MGQTASKLPATQPSETIGRLIDIASRLRNVRRAQRKFIRRWADEKLREFSRDERKPQLRNPARLRGFFND